MESHASPYDNSAEGDPWASPSLPFGWVDWPQQMEAESFIDFFATRPKHEKWELWDGEPRRMMTPASGFHQSIVGRFSSRLEDHCEARGLPFMCIHEVGVRVAEHPSFMPIPDIVVVPESERTERGYVQNFLLAAEVMSPTNTRSEIEDKIGRYAEHRACEYVLVLEQDRPSVVLRARDDGWTDRLVEGATATLSLPAFRFVVPLSYIYHRVIGASR